MTDQSSTPQTVRIDDLAGELIVPPAFGWVVHEITPTRSGEPTLWAWCRVADNAPGYTEVVYTLPDGVTLADPGKRTALGPVVFKAFC